jgi:phosphoglucomutase
VRDIIHKRIEEWTAAPFDHNTISEIKKLIDENKTSELEDRFFRILEFGTGGLRGVIGAGTNRMNIYTVGMATQGLANYIKKTNDPARGAIIARDSRRMSDDFAIEAASVFAGNGIKVYMFKDIAPTPFASFAIRKLNAASGIVITASHNPPEYNGYKAYWDDGGQIIYPHDINIISEVQQINSISMIKKMDFKDAVDSGIITYIDEDILNAYIVELEKAALRKTKHSNVKIAYTPLHGTGYKIIPLILRHFGFNNLSVEESQSKPDCGFKTVKYPNPEEKETLALALDLAKKIDADIIMATDPDADRMGIGFKDGSGGYILINGNQIGTMLECYLLTRLKESGRLPDSGAVIKTIVTTDLQSRIAEDFGCITEEVLTGFKWIANKMLEYENSGNRTFIFGGEESYGYLPVNFVRDKDAVSACYFFAEMTDWLKSSNKTLKDYLDEIYVKYGLYIDSLESITMKGIDGMQKIKSIMEYFRKNSINHIAGVPVNEIRDYQSLDSKNPSSGTMKKIENIPSSDVIQFLLSDGSKITLRPSGTEPKIKFYFSVNENQTQKSLGTAKVSINARLAELKKDFMNRVKHV